MVRAARARRRQRLGDDVPRVDADLRQLGELLDLIADLRPDRRFRLSVNGVLEALGDREQRRTGVLDLVVALGLGTLPSVVEVRGGHGRRSAGGFLGIGVRVGDVEDLRVGREADHGLALDGLGVGPEGSRGRLLDGGRGGDLLLGVEAHELREAARPEVGRVDADRLHDHARLRAVLRGAGEAVRGGEPDQADDA